MKTNFFRYGRLAVAAMLLVLVSAGCSTFKKEWQDTVAKQTTPSGMEGAWDGDWRSLANHHHGRLQCLMVKETEGRYQARFRATFAKIFRSSYTVPLTVLETNGLFQFKGEADLGSLAGGKYTYVGDATRTNLHSTYQSKYDHGVFELSRPQ